MIKYHFSCFYFLTKCDCSFTQYESKPSRIKFHIFVKKHLFKTKEMI